MSIRNEAKWQRKEILEISGPYMNRNSTVVVNSVYFPMMSHRKVVHIFPQLIISIFPPTHFLLLLLYSKSFFFCTFSNTNHTQQMQSKDFIHELNKYTLSKLIYSGDGRYRRYLYSCYHSCCF